MEKGSGRQCGEGSASTKGASPWLFSWEGKPVGLCGAAPATTTGPASRAGTCEEGTNASSGRRLGDGQCSGIHGPPAASTGGWARPGPGGRIEGSMVPF